MGAANRKHPERRDHGLLSLETRLDSPLPPRAAQAITRVHRRSFLRGGVASLLGFAATQASSRACGNEAGGDASEIARSLIPFEQLTPPTQDRLRGVVERPTLHRRLPVQVNGCDPDLYVFFLRHPEVVVNMWQLMGITVIDPLPSRQPVELTPYPKAGDPLPIVQIAVASVGGDAPVFAKLDDYSTQSLLVARAGFTRDGKQAYAYLLNREQTWMDVVTIDLAGGEVRRLFRETTKAWVEEHGALEFLTDGSFLFPSERDGYRHLYRYAADGRLLGRVTEGPWEVLRVHQVDEAAGRVVFSANKENWRGSQLYSAKLEGGDLQRIGAGAGTQTVTWSPRGGLYATSTSTASQPPRVELRDGGGQLVRMLDANPLPALEEFRWGRVEEVQIGLSDGFTLEGRIVFPPDFDAGKRYPVWMKTYGGPHAPTVRDAWQGGGLEDQAHASAGFLVFRVDPRPASGKGAASAWTAYRQLGKQELADLEAAVRWLGTRPYVDLDRVGLSGYSYGGFLTAYALTHSRLFAAGIAGAPVTDWRN